MAEIRLPKLNSLMVSGRACADPELKYLPSGAACLQFRVAVDDSYLPQGESEWKQRSYFFSVTSWGKGAEFLSKRIVKGSAVTIEGKLTSRSWDDKKSGEKRYAVEINAHRVQVLDKRQQAEGGESSAPATHTGGEPEIPEVDIDQIPF